MKLDLSSLPSDSGVGDEVVFAELMVPTETGGVVNWAGSGGIESQHSLSGNSLPLTTTVSNTGVSSSFTVIVFDAGPGKTFEKRVCPEASRRPIC